MTSSSDSTDDLFECALCTSDMVRRNPRVLQCLHSFCEPCLIQLIHDDVIKCPTCRKVTSVTDDDVNDLPINFPLIKMRERELKKSKPPKPALKNDKVCQVCDHAIPLFKCEKCVKNLCMECKEHHDDLSGYKEHPIVELCGAHGDVITHICHQCVTPVCMKCMLGTHKAHKEHFEEYGKDLSKFQSGAKKMYTQMQQVLTVLEEWFEDVKTKAKSTRAIKKGVEEQHERYQERAAYYNQKAREAEQILKVIENKYENHQEFLTVYKDAKDKCTSAMECIKSVATGEAAGIFNRYAVARNRWSKAVNTVKETRDRTFEVPPFVLSEPGSKDIVTYPKDEEAVVKRPSKVEEATKPVKSKRVEEISKPRSRTESKEDLSPKPVIKKKPEVPSRKNTLEQEENVEQKQSKPTPEGSVPKTKKEYKEKGKTKKTETQEPVPPTIDKVAPSGDLNSTTLVMKLNASALSNVITRPHQIAAVGNDSVVIADFDLKHVVRIDYGGNVIGKYTPTITEEPVWGADVYGDNLYILQKSYITKKSLSKVGPDGVGVYKPGGNLCKFAIVNENKFVISDGSAGGVHEYSLQDGDYKQVVGKLNFSSFLSICKTSDNPFYVVTEANAHKLRVYNHKWKSVCKFGGQGDKDGKFNLPGATSVTEKGTILVTDYHNHRISQFTLKGDFINHVLTYKANGIQYPQVLTYQAPYLWVGEKFGDHVAIKCFAVCL